jgi:hypothetical protein
MRIKLTDEDIGYDEYDDTLIIDMNADMNITGKDFYEQLKKQILHEHKFKSAIIELLGTDDLNKIFEIKDKADKYEGEKELNNGLNFVCGNLEVKVKKYKQFAERVKELDKSDIGWYGFDKKLKQLIEGLD